MPYVDPNTVDSPKAIWKLNEVLISTGQGGWSIAKGIWDKEEVIGIRWNGSDDDGAGPGNPHSRGYATWFIIPNELENVVLREIENLKKSRDALKIRIQKPENYDPGAWKIEATLSNDITKSISGEVIFSLPDLPHRFCRADQGFSTARGNEICGIFKNGRWEGHLYSNGIAEEKNPSGIKLFEDTIKRNIEEAISNCV